MTDNVVLFPNRRRGAPPQSLEEVLENVETARKEHIEFIVDEISAAIWSRVYEDGFDLGDESITKPAGLMVESIRAALYACISIDHPLHQVAEQLFISVDNNEESSID